MAFSTMTPTKLVDEALPTASATLFTAANPTILKEIVIANTNAAYASVTISAGGLALVPAISVSGNGINIIDLSKVMAADDILAGFASVTGVNVFISGVVMQ